MKKALLLVLAVAFLAASVPVFAEYNKEATVNAMRNNLAGYKKAMGAAATGDYYAAADGLMEIAKDAIMLADMDPPKGSKDEWKATQLALARAAFKAIGACGSADKAAFDAAMGEIGAVMKKGHGTFKG